jgi:hypothetical protein
MAKAICTKAAAVTIMDGDEAAGTITAGAIMVTTDYAVFCGRLLSSSHCPNESRHLQWMVAPMGATSSFFEVCQPRSISTAIRIRSEWFFALSFCLSNEVVLATVL